MELVRLGGLVPSVFNRALSSQVDFVGDQRFRERESRLVDVDIRGVVSIGKGFEGCEISLRGDEIGVGFGEGSGSFCGMGSLGSSFWGSVL